jgi:catechol 2,3-dioxygenase-like lactoylglutathione lyase family enzyme
VGKIDNEQDRQERSDSFSHGQIRKSTSALLQGQSRCDNAAMFEIEALDHVALAVSDVEKSADWYCDVLGFKRQHEGMWNGVPVFVGKGDADVALFPIPDARSTSSSAGGARVLHFALRTDWKNFLAVQTELKEREIEFDFEDHEVSHSIYFRDPDGHKIEITTYELK